jgi:glucose-6-phosphate 1-epimerase
VNEKSIVSTTGNGGLPLLKIYTPRSAAEIYLHGAHVSHFQKNGEPPLLFMSRLSRFEAGKAIRGGVPICFPWFGSRSGQPAHGLARILTWELSESSVAPDGSVKVVLKLPQTLLPPEWSSLRTEFAVSVAETLTMELVATNTSGDEALEIEHCLHTYFHIGEISAVSIAGLQGTTYLDNTSSSGERLTDNDAELKITKEVDRTYLDTANAVEIRDEKFRRTIRVEKLNSKSTVVWNPWTTKKMEDFDSAEHANMVCVESGNVKQNKISLAPGKTAALKVILSSAPLK